MSCNTCKSKSNEKSAIVESKTTGNKLIPVKILLFIIAGVILTPFIIPIFLWALFRVIVLSKEVDITPLLKYIGRKIFKEEEEEEDHNEELNEDEYELEDPNDIIEFKHK